MRSLPLTLAVLGSLGLAGAPAIAKTSARVACFFVSQDPTATDRYAKRGATSRAKASSCSR